LTGTLNRVMIVELHAGLACRAHGSIPVLMAPFRALDWLQIRYAQIGAGLAARALLSGRDACPVRGLFHLPLHCLRYTEGAVGNRLYGEIGAALAFLMVGAGLHTVQTAGMALATDLAPALCARGWSRCCL